MLRTVLPFVGVLLAAAQAIAKCRPVMPQPGKNWSKHNAAHVTTDKAHHVAAGRVPLAAVAAMSSTTSISLHAFLMTPHVNMPNYRLTPQEIDDVVTYILSLRRRRG